MDACDPDRTAVTARCTGQADPDRTGRLSRESPPGLERQRRAQPGGRRHEVANPWLIRRWTSHGHRGARRAREPSMRRRRSFEGTDPANASRHRSVVVWPPVAARRNNTPGTFGSVPFVLPARTGGGQRRPAQAAHASCTRRCTFRPTRPLSTLVGLTRADHGCAQQEQYPPEQQEQLPAGRGTDGGGPRRELPSSSAGGTSEGDRSRRTAGGGTCQWL